MLAEPAVRRERRDEDGYANKPEHESGATSTKVHQAGNNVPRAGRPAWLGGQPLGLCWSGWRGAGQEGPADASGDVEAGQGLLEGSRRQLFQEGTAGPALAPERRASKYRPTPAATRRPRS